jgi:hypothetical protein
MYLSTGAVAADEQAPPDQWPDVAQDEAQLVDDGGVERMRLKHPAIMAPQPIGR